MTATSASQNANVVVNTCRDNDMQKWWQNKDGRFHLLRNPDLCLDYKGLKRVRNYVKIILGHAAFDP